MKTLPIMQPKDAVRYIERKYPPGTVLRFRASGETFTMGRKSGLSKFDLTRDGDSRVLTEHATRLVMAYERVNR
jgi:hypothetical protein